MIEEDSRIRAAVISDGKAGHLHQSEGLAQRLDRAHVRVFEVTYGDGWFYRRAALAARFGPRSRGALRRWAAAGLGGEALEGLLEFGPRVVISTGALTAPMNLYCSRLAGAVNVVCMRPNLLPLSAFDLVVIPEHDSPPTRPNVLTTVGALNTVDPAKVADQAREFAAREGIDPRRRTLGVLLGGGSKIYLMEPEPVRRLLEAVSRACAETGAQWLITTSRRTPPGVDLEVERLAADDPNCAYCLIASRDPYNPVSGIVGLSTAVVVTSDSVSMVSETASAGRRALICPVDKRKPGPVKYEKLFSRLVALGYAVELEPDDAGAILVRELGSGERPEPLDEARKAADAVRRMLG